MTERPGNMTAVARSEVPAVHLRDFSIAPSLPSLVRSPSLAIFQLGLSSRPSVTAILPFAEQVRRALIRNRADTSHSEAITGKRADGVPLEGHEHAHYLPTDEDGDGLLDHVTIYCPRGFDEADVEAIRNLRTIYGRGNRGDVRMILIRLGGVEMFAKPARCLSVTEPGAVATGLAGANTIEAEPSANSQANSNHRAADTHQRADGDVRRPTEIFATSKRWVSVTPFSLPRFPNRGGGKPPRPRDLPEAQLVQELAARGLPDPVSIKRIEGYQPNGRPMVRWLEFQTKRFKGTQGKGLAGFEIEFAEPDAGPIAVGFGCHFGLGLFLPV